MLMSTSPFHILSITSFPAVTSSVMWKPPPELGLSYVLGVSTARNRTQALRTYNTTGEAGALGIELLVFDHAGFHPSYTDATRLMRQASRSSASGWELLQGMRKWRDAHFEDAYALIARAANREPFAMAVLGFMTERGIGVPASQQRAMELYTRAGDCPWAVYLLAEIIRRKRGIRSARRVANGCLNDGVRCWLGDALMKEDPIAARRLFQAVEHDYGRVKLAEMYDRGCGGRTDVLKAKRLYEEATTSGNSKAMCLQGVAWRKGTFGNVDLEKARQLFEMAVECNDTTGMVLLGSMYESGMGVTQEKSSALRLYKKASDMGNSFGYLSQAKMLLFDNAAKAQELLEKARVFGNDVVQCEALYELGRVYESGRGVERNYGNALSLYKRCDRFGITPTTVKAVTRIGYLFERGHGAKKSEIMARGCYEYAAGLEDGEAAFRLGMMAERSGDQAARDWYLMGASFGWVDAAYRLGRLLEEGEISAAVECYSTAAELGCTDAQLRLGRMMVLGRGIDLDIEKGRSLLTRAAEGGSVRARKLLGELAGGRGRSRRN